MILEQDCITFIKGKKEGKNGRKNELTQTEEEGKKGNSDERSVNITEGRQRRKTG